MIRTCIERLSKNIVLKKRRSYNYLYSSSGSPQAGGVRYQVTVPVVTADWLIKYYDSPDFVKIDVEGAEDKVFKSAAKMLAENRPVILCEVYPHNEAEITGIFKKYHYVMYNASGADKKDIGSVLNRAAYNTLTFPEEYKFE